MRNILLKVKYDGRDFSGWQAQPEKRTVQGELEKALGHIYGREISIQGSSRTDKGVHALGQCANFKTDVNLPVDKLPYVVNNFLKGRDLTGPDLEVLSAQEVEEDFHARFNAVGKRYIYKILWGQKPDIFKRHHYYQTENILDVSAMERAAEGLVGCHDFRCFMAAGGSIQDDTVRTIYRASFSNSDVDSGLLAFEIVGDGFLYNMVRIIVGTLVDIGMGKNRDRYDVKDEARFIQEIISSGDRGMAGHTAPPGGLYLDAVFFDKNEMLGNESQAVGGNQR